MRRYIGIASAGQQVLLLGQDLHRAKRPDCRQRGVEGRADLRRASREMLVHLSEGRAGV
jgi:hypothetical protein